MNPKSFGGKIAWGPLSDHYENILSEEVACRSEGPFKVNDFYCDESKYVWRCKEENLCNSVIPLENLDKIMWDTWELTSSVPAELKKQNSKQEDQ